MKLCAAHATFHLLLAGCMIGPAVARAQMKTSPPDADATAFRGYLTEHGLAPRWSGDPAPLTSPELRAAYPGFRFYYTFRSPPPTPGARVPDVIEAHRQAMEEYNSIRCGSPSASTNTDASTRLPRQRISTRACNR